MHSWLFQSSPEASDSYARACVVFDHCAHAETWQSLHEPTPRKWSPVMSMREAVSLGGSLDGVAPSCVWSAAVPAAAAAAATFAAATSGGGVAFLFPFSS